LYPAQKHGDRKQETEMELK